MNNDLWLEKGKEFVITRLNREQGRQDIRQPVVCDDFTARWALREHIQLWVAHDATRQQVMDIRDERAFDRQVERILQERGEWPSVKAFNNVLPINSDIRAAIIRVVVDRMWNTVDSIRRSL